MTPSTDLPERTWMGNAVEQLCDVSSTSCLCRTRITLSTSLDALCHRRCAHRPTSPASRPMPYVVEFASRETWPNVNPALAATTTSQKNPHAPFTSRPQKRRGLRSSFGPTSFAIPTLSYRPSRAVTRGFAQLLAQPRISIAISCSSRAGYT